MRFITEADLRERCRKAPFTEYVPEPDTRLTPGGRQFLNDRGIRIVEENGKKQTVETAETGKNASEGKTESTCTADVQEKQMETWHLKLHTVQAEFLDAGLKLFSKDVLLAKEVFELERVLASADRGEGALLDFHDCTGLKAETCTENQGDCFEITGFHAQSPKGMEIVILHSLRCRLREVLTEIPKREQKMIMPVVNRLSQMICLAFGGKICQKQ